MKSTIKTKTIKLPVYDQVITFIVGKDYDDYMARKYKMDKPDDGAYARTVILKSVDTGDRVIVVAIPEFVWGNLNHMATLAHECVHATSDVFYEISSKHTEDTEEHYAYIFDYIYGQALKWLKPKKK